MLTLKHLELWVRQVVVLDTVCVDARETSLFADETLARMATLMDFVTAGLHNVNASWCSADVLESLLVTDRRLLQLLPAESALECCLEVCCFFATSSQMVWLLLAAGAEILRALLASYSVLGHMLGCLLTDDLTFFVFFIIVNLGLL